ncbi:helix-turn-helix domain-containing protein [Citrobacter portucalensis]|uniref:helix-turn-helix domain-containing protein n=1 Tax=Citrobacter TaxID=544 RepID=UPI00257580F7|nr:helix-turn-helix domain-containing protein [Citrobacter sp. Cpo107]MDM2809714.1 helix-turn-helix domain-containing protein [Citrobacter sp. Cpo107]
MKSNTINDILFYIEDNFVSGVDIDDITRFSGYSRRHIQDILKQRIDMPVGLYIRKRRITKAASLLRLTCMDIIDISVRLGFDSQQSFCREFKKLTGYTPREYRKNLSWDLAPLFSLTPQSGIVVSELQLCTLPVDVVHGVQYNYDSPVPPASDSHLHRLNLIFEQLNSSRQNVWALTEFSPNPNSTTRLKIKSIIGIKNHHSANRYNRYDCPSGNYACVTFRFSKESYPQYSKYIYLKVMSQHKLKRNPGCDIEVFHYNEQDINNKIITCDHYIPVNI